jgi:AraC family transcriptional regulator
VNGTGNDIAISATMDAVSRFTGKAPLASASMADGRDVSAALWQHSPRTRRFEGHECDILAISLRGDATLEQIENGRSVWRGPAPGSIVLLRAGDPTDWHLDGPFQMLHIYMSSASAQAALPAKLSRPFRDPLLFQLARSVSLALTESDGNAGYMAPLLDSVQRCFDERYFERQASIPLCDGPGLTGFARGAVTTFIRDNLDKDLRSEDLAKEAKCLRLLHRTHMGSEQRGGDQDRLLLGRQRRNDRSMRKWLRRTPARRLPTW